MVHLKVNSTLVSIFIQLLTNNKIKHNMKHKLTMNKVLQTAVATLQRTTA